MLQKIITHTVATSLAIFTLNAQADIGVCNYDKQNVDSIKCFGNTNISNTNVSGPIFVRGPLTILQSSVKTMDIAGAAQMESVNALGTLTLSGMLKAQKSSFASIRVLGDVNLDKTTVTGEVKIKGLLVAKQSLFEKNIEITTQQIELNATDINNNLVVVSTEGKPEVQVYCKSNIKGSVTFQGSAGIVKVSPDSKVGKIINGTTETLQKNCD